MNKSERPFFNGSTVIPIEVVQYRLKRHAGSPTTYAKILGASSVERAAGATNSHE